jgi:hypothetical protein
MGFETRYQLVDAESCGNAVSQARLVICSFSIGEPRGMGESSFLPATSLACPLYNCLRPFRARHIQDSFPATNNNVPDGTTVPMPSKCRESIQTTTGYRRSLADELTNGPGRKRDGVASKPATLTTLLEDTCGKRSGSVLSISSEIWLDTSRPPRPMGPDALPCTSASTDSQPPTGDLHLGESPENPLTVGPRRWIMVWKSRLKFVF